MSRVNVWVPDAMLARFREVHPGANMSQMVQDALGGVLSCAHKVGVVCATCGAHVDAEVLRAEGRRSMWRSIDQRVRLLTGTGGTMVGACKVIRDEGVKAGIPEAAACQEQRLTRANREKGFAIGVGGMGRDR